MGLGNGTCLVRVAHCVTREWKFVDTKESF